MLTSDFRVNGKVVEFGLVLPDGRRLPIDSKWTALAELEALDAATDPVVRVISARAPSRSRCCYGPRRSRSTSTRR